jgi:hypothetical protein
VSKVTRSWTDAVTNLTFLTPPEFAANLTDFVTPGKVPPRTILPVFLHESTHHWCFHSSVGSTIALMQLRARRSAYWTKTDPRPNAIELSRLQAAMLHDLLLSETAMSVMAPLSEGLALFAEFDTLPGKSPVLSQPTAWALSLHGNARVTSESKPIEPVMETLGRASELLLSVRTTPAVRTRLEDVLQGPLTGYGGGYLAGYLTVKRMWRKAREDDERFDDAELFLSFMRAYFYGDSAMVGTLLDPSLSEAEAVETIVVQFQSRVRTFMEADLGTDLDRFESQFAGGETKRGLGTVALGIEPNEAEQHEMRLDALLDELEAWSPEKLESEGELGFGEMLHLEHYAILQGRDLLTMAVVPVTVDVVAGTVRARSGESVLWEDEVLPGVDPVEGPGFLELYLSGGLHSRICAVVCNGEPVTLRAVPTLSQADSSIIARQLILRRAMLAEGELWRLNEEKLLRTTWVQARLESHYRGIDAAVDEMYVRYATSHISDESVRAVQLAMRQRGFFDSLDRKPELVSGLALLLLCGSVQLVRGSAAVIFERHGLDFESTVAALLLLSSRTEVFRIRADPLFVRCWI